MHRSTKIVLALVAGAFLYANAAESPLWREYGSGTPTEYGLIREFLFSRGWPLSPWMVCPLRGMMPRPGDSFVWWPLIVDAIVAVVPLCAVAFLMERGICCWRMRRGAYQFTLTCLFLVTTMLALPLTIAYYYLYGPEWLRGIIGLCAADVPRTCLFAFSLIAVFLAGLCRACEFVSRRPDTSEHKP
jgi:hypothetical protein